MRFAQLVAAAAVTTAALALPVTPSHAADDDLDGCVTTYLDNRNPYLIDGSGIVSVDLNTLEVYANGGAVVNIAAYIAFNEANMAAALAFCIV